MDISRLYFLVTSRYVFNDQAYPGLKSIDKGEPTRAFILNHVLSHAVKQTGKLATIAETFDHEQAFAKNARTIIRESSAKLIVNAVQLAFHFGINHEELEQAINESLK